MAVITFEDNLVHYKSRLSEVRDYLDEISTQLNAALDVAESSSWQGQSAHACTVKLEDLKPELEKVQSFVNTVDADVREIEALVLTQII